VTSKFKELFKFLLMPLALIFKYSGILAMNKNFNSQHNEYSFVGLQDQIG